MPTPAALTSSPWEEHAAPPGGETDVLVLHAQWSDGSLHVWAESQSAFVAAHAGRGPETPAGGEGAPVHPFVATRADLAARLRIAEGGAAETSRLTLAMPSHSARMPLPSPHLAHLAGSGEEDDEEFIPENGHAAPAVEPAPIAIERFIVGRKDLENVRDSVMEAIRVLQEASEP